MSLTCLKNRPIFLPCHLFLLFINWKKKETFQTVASDRCQSLFVGGNNSPLSCVLCVTVILGLTLTDRKVLMLIESCLFLTVPFLSLSFSGGGGEVEGHPVYPGTPACFWHVQLPAPRPLVWRQRVVCGLQRQSCQSHSDSGKPLISPGFSSTCSCCLYNTCTS